MWRLPLKLAMRINLVPILLYCFTVFIYCLYEKLSFYRGGPYINYFTIVFIFFFDNVIKDILVLGYSSDSRWCHVSRSFNFGSTHFIKNWSGSVVIVGYTFTKLCIWFTNVIVRYTRKIFYRYNTNKILWWFYLMKYFFFLSISYRKGKINLFYHVYVIYTYTHPIYIYIYPISSVPLENPD